MLRTIWDTGLHPPLGKRPEKDIPLCFLTQYVAPSAQPHGIQPDMRTLIPLRCGMQYRQTGMYTPPLHTFSMSILDDLFVCPLIELQGPGLHDPSKPTEDSCIPNVILDTLGPVSGKTSVCCILQIRTYDRLHLSVR